VQRLLSKGACSRSPPYFKLPAVKPSVHGATSTARCSDKHAQCTAGNPTMGGVALLLALGIPSPILGTAVSCRCTDCKLRIRSQRRLMADEVEEYLAQQGWGCS
jgi:hypothetical protein